MGKSQNARNALLLLIIIIGLGYYFYNRPHTGPVATATDQQGAQDQDPNMVSNPHGGNGGPSIPDVELNAGNPAITLGDTWVGSDWLNTKVAQYTAAQEGQDSPHGADPDAALRQALFEGVSNLVFDNVVKEFGIQASEDELAAKEATFYGTFNTREEAQDLLDSMGMTMDKVRKMWTDELEQSAFIATIAAMNSLDPASDEAKKAADDWFLQRIAGANLVFADESQKAMFDSILQQRLTAAAPPHGGMEGEPDPNNAEPEPDSGQGSVRSPEPVTSGT
jgi:hypothetical protein